MNIKDKILSYLKQCHTATGRELCALLGISRQALNKHVKKMIVEGLIVKEGMTRGAVYRLRSGKEKPVGKIFNKRYLLADVEEHLVFQQADLALNLRKELPDNVFEIVNYAFTEILNNAVEHSESEWCRVKLELDPYRCCFEIKDSGIGIFYSIYKKLGLENEISAVGELIKGKTTTFPERHTGEGVFFTSKCGDVVSFRSHRLKLIFHMPKQDVFLEEGRCVEGTHVRFLIGKQSRRKLSAVFDAYAPEKFEYGFERTQVAVKLFAKEYLSRSEARRLLAGLDKFREIILDFKNVKSLGRGFADEIFRVFKQDHPEITITTENLTPALSAMIKHWVDNNNN